MTGVLNSAYRFASFVVGSSNRLAASAARAVAEAPGDAYNPLFVYGGSGLGKTHLVSAIAYHARLVSPQLRVEFSSGEDVAERLHRAIGSGQPQHFAEHFQQVDLLILDDVQFLTGQRETQSELLRLFNVMQGDGRQLVMTSDRQPSEIPDVDQRLLSRLSGGLVVDVGAPDYEMRLAILRNMGAERRTALADGVLEEVARLAFDNVRELKGALNKLAAYQQIEHQPVSASDVRAILGERVGVAIPTVPGRLSAIIPDGTVEYEGFLADVLQEVETRVEPWRVLLGEAITQWRGHGYTTQVLERALALPYAPDVDALLATFAAAVEHLRNIEGQAVVFDATVRGHAAFRHVERIADAQEMLDHAIASALPLPGPTPTFTRDAFAQHSGSELAIAAFDEVIAAPGVRYNPLLLQGPAGSGKTHLAHALGNAMREAYPGKKVACLSASAFVDELIAAMQEGGVERWRIRFRHADVFILDDVQHLAEKERTQEELFHLFNHLYERGCQIVLTSDRPTRDVQGLVDRLRSRFEGGLAVTLPTRARQRLERFTAPAPGDVDAFFTDREKMVWRWPDVGGRLIEEYR